MRKVPALIVPLVSLAASLFCPRIDQAQTSADIYNSIKTQPSTVRWCLPEAGEDGASIIGGRCKVYRECLASVNLDDSVDRKPFPVLSAVQVEDVRKCHQALYNAARVNPQVKGSGATQQWLEHLVYPGTQAKPFAIPGVVGTPR
jgi:hypothetical protein